MSGQGRVGRIRSMDIIRSPIHKAYALRPDPARAAATFIWRDVWFCEKSRGLRKTSRGKAVDITLRHRVLTDYRCGCSSGMRFVPRVYSSHTRARLSVVA